MTTNTIQCVGTGLQFKFGYQTYVRIPEMILQCDGLGFVVNVILVEESPNNYIPPKIVADFLHPDTVVEMIG